MDRFLFLENDDRLLALLLFMDTRVLTIVEVSSEIDLVQVKTTQEVKDLLRRIFPDLVIEEIKLYTPSS